ncbi:hypothetical protein GCM10023340_38360 [Nocardioides marinquilinus]|uniref:Uncharacterized protein n=1 Tax=Nocardioides marinquilinus TaxID=1210400 RepID=A0ABP9Q602_9ACTN
MSFELLPHLTPWIVGFAVLALAGLVVGAAAVRELVVATSRRPITTPATPATRGAVRAHTGRLATHH